jgi:hydrogenase nickel incorporation protein HypA/HybF
MHEERLIADLVAKVEELARAQGARRVTRIRFWVGALSHVREETLGARWPIAARGTTSERATLDVEQSGDLDDPRAQSVVLRSFDIEPSAAPREAAP